MFLNNDEKEILNLLGSDGSLPIADEVIQSLQDTAAFSDDIDAKETAAELLRKLAE